MNQHRIDCGQLACKQLIFALSVLLNITILHCQDSRSNGVAMQESNISGKPEILLEYKEVVIPQHVFQVESDVFREPLGFAVKMKVNFGGTVVNQVVQPLQDLSQRKWPEEVWKTCSDSISAAVRQWKFYDVTSNDYVGTFTRDYLSMLLQKCPHDGTFGELMLEANKKSYIYFVYVTFMVTPTECNISSSWSMNVLAK